MADSKSAKPFYNKKDHEPNGFGSAKKPQQNHHNAYAVCGNWGIFRSSSCGKFYYHNSANGASQWEKPREWNIKPDIDELIITYGNSSNSQRDHQTPSASQRSSSSFSQQPQRQSHSSSAKRPQQLMQFSHPSSRNGDSPHAHSLSTDQRREFLSSSKQYQHSSSNTSNHIECNNSMDAPPKRRKHDNSPGGTPHSSGSGGSINVSSQNKAISQLSEVLIQQVRDRLDNIQGKVVSTSQNQNSWNRVHPQPNVPGLSPSYSSLDNQHSGRPSASNTRPGSPLANANCVKMDVDSDLSTKSSTDLPQQRLLAEEPFFSLSHRCERTIENIDLSPGPEIFDLRASSKDEMASRLEKQAERLRAETVSRYDAAASTAVHVKAQRSIVRKIDIMSEINAKRIANTQKQIDELVASRKDLASMLTQQPRLAPFMPPLGMATPASAAPSVHR